MSENEKDEVPSKTSESSSGQPLDMKDLFEDAIFHFELAFNEMQDLQKKDISNRILKAEERLDKIENELLDFLKV